MDLPLNNYTFIFIIFTYILLLLLCNKLGFFSCIDNILSCIFSKLCGLSKSKYKGI